MPFSLVCFVFEALVQASPVPPMSLCANMEYWPLLLPLVLHHLSHITYVFLHAINVSTLDSTCAFEAARAYMRFNMCMHADEAAAVGASPAAGEGCQSTAESAGERDWRL